MRHTIFTGKSVIVFNIIIIALCIVLKIYYRIGPVEHFKILLYPVSLIVSLTTDTHFSFIAHTGYVNTTGMIVIGKICSGVNFFITCTLITLYHFFSVEISFVKAVGYFCLVILANYCLVILAGVSRISTALVFLKVTAGYAINQNIGDWIHYCIGIIIFICYAFGYNYLLLRIKPWINARQALS